MDKGAWPTTDTTDRLSMHTCSSFWTSHIIDSWLAGWHQALECTLSHWKAVGTEEQARILSSWCCALYEDGHHLRNAQYCSSPISSAFTFSHYFLWVPIALLLENALKSPTLEAFLSEAGIAWTPFLTWN